MKKIELERGVEFAQGGHDFLEKGLLKGFQFTPGGRDHIYLECTVPKKEYGLHLLLLYGCFIFCTETEKVRPVCCTDFEVYGLLYGALNAARISRSKDCCTSHLILHRNRGVRLRVFAVRTAH